MEQYFKMLKKCIADFEFSAGIDHNLSKGAFREQIIKKLLKPFLPCAYGLSSGQAFDGRGRISNQLDVVIYDSLHSYVAPYETDFIYFPYESVYGNIEVKSRLNTDSLNKAMANIQSLKQLERSKIDTFYVNPIKPLVIKNVNWEITATSECFGIVFAYESDINIDTVLKNIKKNVDEKIIGRENIPNMIVLLKERKIISRFRITNDEKYEIAPLGDYQGLLVEDCGEEILSEFIITLFIILRSIELKAMNIEKMSLTIQEKIFNREGKRVINNIII